MDVSLRCTGCGACWPNDTEYGSCPECEADTYVSRSNEPMPEDEAHTRMTHARFERWLDEHDRRGPVETLELIPTKAEHRDAA